jgi:hypothetical protein
MTSQPANRTVSLRAFLVAVALLVATAFASGPAAAGTLIPAYDAGGPGGGGGGAAETTDIAASNVPGIREF